VRNCQRIIREVDRKSQNIDFLLATIPVVFLSCLHLPSDYSVLCYNFVRSSFSLSTSSCRGIHYVMLQG
jgi:hypothetical protein